LKTITIFIVNDSYGESDENFNVALSSPVGGTLGAPSVVTVTIHSDESVDGPNPVRDASFDTDFFVREHYVDFLIARPIRPAWLSGKIRSIPALHRLAAKYDASMSRRHSSSRLNFSKRVIWLSAYTKPLTVTP